VAIDADIRDAGTIDEQRRREESKRDQKRSGGQRESK
jgi:hypothetical protein